AWRRPVCKTSSIRAAAAQPRRTTRPASAAIPAMGGWEPRPSAAAATPARAARARTPAPGALRPGAIIRSRSEAPDPGQLDAVGDAAGGRVAATGRKAALQHALDVLVFEADVDCLERAPN